MNTSTHNIFVLQAGGPCAMSFMKYVRKAEPSARIVAADMDPNSAARYLADVFIQVPAANSDGYGKLIADILKEHKISMMAPCLSFSLDLFDNVENAFFFNNLETSMLCSDKWLFYQWCKENAIRTPHTILLSEVTKPSVPCYVKPRIGAGAKYNYSAQTAAQYKGLLNFIDNKADFIVQDLIMGDHIIVEAMRLDSELVSCVAMREFVSKAGNAYTVEIVHDPKLVEITQNLLSVMGFQGPANIDFMQDRDGNYFVLEVNPRFGSTVEFVAETGHNTPAFLVTRDRKYLAHEPKGVYSIIRQAVCLSAR